MSISKKLAFLSVLSSILLGSVGAQASTQLLCTLSTDGVEVDGPQTLGINQQRWDVALASLKQGREVALVDSMQSTARFGKIRVGAYLVNVPRDGSVMLRLEELTSDGGRTEAVLAYVELPLRNLVDAIGRGVTLNAKLPREQEVTEQDGVYLWTGVRCSTQGSAR